MKLFLYRVCEWIMKLAFVNLLWLCFTLFGFIILGLFPATIAMFFIIRKWIMGETDIPILKAFWNTYKGEFIKGNFLGGLLLGLGFIILFEIFILNNSPDPVLKWSKYPLFLLIIMFCFLLLYTLPSYVHYNVNVVKVIKNAFLIMLINPFYNVVMLLGLVLIYLLINIIPPLILFFGGSISAIVIMWSCYQSFLNIERRKEKLKNVTNHP